MTTILGFAPTDFISACQEILVVVSYTSELERPPAAEEDGDKQLASTRSRILRLTLSLDISGVRSCL